MRIHVFNLHGVNMSKAMYGNAEEFERYHCELCESSYKYKKDLNAHIRLKHQGPTQKFQCDE